MELQELEGWELQDQELQELEIDDALLNYIEKNSGETMTERRARAAGTGNRRVFV